ncbi:MAG TPA: universal stress protein [Bacteroidia bacterium]|jgi:nucleotide-binding universal stress UspA family protein
MKNFNPQKILIPIDFSETSLIAIEHGAFTAQLFKAELVLLHVVEKHWEKFSVVAPELRVEAPSDLINSIERRLEELAADIRSKYGVKSTCITSDGNIFTEIIAVSKENNVDLIVMGTHGTSGFVEFFVGSNTYKVVTEAVCPVISVRAHSDKVGFQNIMLPIDDSPHSRQKVNHAIVLAKHFAAKIHILGLADSDEGSELKMFEVKLDGIEEYIRKCNIPCSRKTINGGNQARVSYDYAKSVNADLMVIMTDQDENMTGRLLGTYAQQVINHSKIPVMSIHPVEANIPFVFPY